MELIEIVNLEVCKKLNGLSFSEFENLFKKSLHKIDDNGEEIDVRADYTKTKNFCKSILQNNNRHKVNYKYVKGKDFGRLQSSEPSLQRIFNPFRGLLCNNKMFDLDMNNAHPKILIKLCKKHDINHSILKNYIDNREEWLEEISRDFKVDRKEAKSILLKSINKENLTTHHNNKLIKNKRFLEFDKQTSEIINKLFDVYNKDYLKYVVNESYNQKGKMMNLILCKIENEYLQKAIKYLTDKKIKVSVLMFDGCMIYKENANQDEIIKDLNKLFKKEDMQWSFKSHNLELEEDFNKIKEEQKIDSFIGENIIEIAEHILDGILLDKIYKCHSEIIYITSYKIIKNEKIIKEELYKLISQQNYIEHRVDLKGNDKYPEVSKEHKYIENLVVSIINKAPRDDKFNKKIWNDTLYKIYFKNGYYDFKLKEFIKGEFNKTYVKIDRDYNCKSNKKVRDEIYSKILNPIFTIKKNDEFRNQLLRYYLHRMSRIIAGHIEDKRWILFQGLRNSGKGMISDMLKNSFDGYVRTTNAENFISKKVSGDASKANSWIIDYEYVRLAITQEITVIEKEYIDGNMIKKFCSGGDYMDGRKNFKDEYEFRIQSALMVSCNDIPEIRPTDAEEFKEEFQLKSKFVEKDFDESKKLATFEYYEKEEGLKTNYLQKDEVIDEFTNIILEAYYDNVEYPKVLKDELKELEDDEDMTKLFNLFEYTDNEEKKDVITNDELREIIKESKIPFTLKKCKLLLRTKGCNEYRDATKRGISNIKLKE
jgi:hypothetical protein